VAEGEKVSPKQILVDIDPSTIEETQTEAWKTGEWDCVDGRSGVCFYPEINIGKDF
jgi:hypothetical protein